MIILKKQKKNKFFRKGFSIGEVMLAGFVLSVAMVSIISLIAVSIRHSIDSRDHIIASGLAQEGIELARNLIDNQRYGDTDPDDSFVDFPSTEGDCRIDYNSSSACSNGGSDYSLKYNNSGFYEYNNGTNTKFSRIFHINHDSSSNSATITVYVSWDGKDPKTDACTLGNKCVSVSSLFYNQ